MTECTRRIHQIQFCRQIFGRGSISDKDAVKQLGDVVGSDALVEKFKFQMSDYKISMTSRLLFLDLAPDASDNDDTHSNPFLRHSTLFGRKQNKRIL